MKKNDLMTMLVCVALVISAGRAGAGQPAQRPSDAVQDEVRKLIQGVQSKNLMTRMEAAKKLGALGARAQAAVPHLIHILGDKERFYWDGLVDGRMTGGSRSGGEEAAAALVKIGEPALQPLIAALATHANPLVRWAAAGALGRMNDRRSVEPLLQALADRDGSVAQAAAWALGETKVPGLVDILYARLGDKVPAEAEGILEALARQGDTRVFPVLADRLKGTDINVRLNALRLLGLLKSPESFAPVSTALNDPDSRIRKAVADALGDLKDGRALAGLLGLLEDSDAEVRYSAVYSLIDLRDPAALEPLRRLIARESNGNVRQAAEAAVKLLSK